MTRQVISPDGKPTEGASVIVRGARDGPAPFRQVDDASATTDRDGRLTLVLHAGVRYEVLVFLNVTPSEQLNATAPVPAENSGSEFRVVLKRTR
ncbi:MAG TPA: hypothetical protein VKA59_23460 [Vicinamibacterales bacterium]|nr:hypothetical protein [Vicinamibacterales bacterium]